MVNQKQYVDDTIMYLGNSAYVIPCLETCIAVEYKSESLVNLNIWKRFVRRTDSSDIRSLFPCVKLPPWTISHRVISQLNYPRCWRFIWEAPVVVKSIYWNIWIVKMITLFISLASPVLQVNTKAHIITASVYSDAVHKLLREHKYTYWKTVHTNPIEKNMSFCQT